MKQNRSRLIALLLALCLLVGALPTLALADDAILTMDDYQNARNRVEEALAAPDVPVEQTNQHYVARSSEVESIVKSTVTGDLSVDSATAFALPVAGRLELRAPEAEAYRWQIRVGDQWANIVGDTESEMVLTYAKLQNALSGNAAVVRCALTRAGETVYTAEATVTVDPNVETETTTVTEQIPVTSYYQPSAVSRAKALNEGVMAANDGPTPSTYTILINYIFADGKQAAPSWSATVATGSTYTQDIQSPVVVGYTPSEAVVQVNTSEAKTYTVTYQPAEVEFTVKHYQQNVSNDEYTLADTETKKGYTESAVGAGLAKTDYTGFYSLLYDATPTIAADGSTKVEIYYDRNYYLMNFNLDGGYGVEPIYARFGASISVGTPTKPGYTFEGWDKEIPATMPAENKKITAKWIANDTAKVTVVIWGENADDEDYSYIKSSQIDAKPGTEFTYSDSGALVCNLEEHTHSESCYELTCGQTEHTHTWSCYPDTSSTKASDEVIVWDPPRHPKEGQIHKHRLRNVKGIYVHGVWYLYTGKQKDGSIVTPKDQEHVHTDYTGSCYTQTCSKTEHTHNENCYMGGAGLDSDLWKFVRSDTVTVKADGSSVVNVYYDRVEKTLTFKYDYDYYDYNKTETITAKWGENISTRYKKIAQNAGSTFWSAKSTGEEPFTNYFGIMPIKNATYYCTGTTGDDGTMTYWGEDQDGNYTVKLFEVTGVGGYSVSDEDRYEFNGYTYDHGTSNGNSCNGAEFYYKRNSYNLTFNDGKKIVKDEKVKYEATLGSYDFVPEMPTELYEAGSREFGGWYLNPECTGIEYKLSQHTMPADNVLLYAKWVPVNRTVKTWLTDKMDTPVNVGDTGSNVQTIPHGSFATKPADPKNGNYTFVGWFYTENGEEKAFDFSMPVNRDLNLYAKWSSNTLMSYTVEYKLENGTQIAPPTTGSALAGSTKTFDAKTGTQLNEGYQKGYFPKVSSHSITIDIADASKNKYTFVYVAKDEVEYTVRYLDKATGEPVVVDGVPTPDKVVKTRDAVVTETFKQITGYAPDAYQKQLVLAAENNEIIFWYTKDEVHAPVQIIHWTQNIEGDGYTEYQSSTNLNGVIGTEYPETPLTIAGFRYNEEKSNAKGTLTAEGLVLKLYYDRIEYPYEFRFLEQGTDKELATSVTGNARYQAQVTQTAKTIPGYTLVSAENQAIHIAIEDGTTAVKNVKIFYYTEQTVDIKYEVVGPTGCGTLDNYQETQLKVTTGEVKGSTSTAASGFKFVGWYKDAACTVAVDGAWVDVANKLTPGKTKNYGTAEKPVMGYEAATYYAKFEYDTFDLTIKKEGLNKNTYGKSEDVESAIFTVSGGNQIWTVVCDADNNYSVTLTGLKCGTEYTVTEQNGWTWRYNGTNSEKFTHSGGPEKVLTFKNTLSNPYWLGGDNFKTNVFGSSTGN